MFRWLNRVFLGATITKGAAAVTCRAILLATTLPGVTWNAPNSSAAHWYLDMSAPQSDSERFPRSGVKTIREVIHVASDEGRIIPAQGVGTENIRVHRKNIILRSSYLVPTV
jgi:hypothetical protein